MQGFLDILGIPYNGPGVMASAIAMNKIATKRMLMQGGLATPPYSVYGKASPESTIEQIARDRGFPCFVKCPQSGSSRLMGKADNVDSMREMLMEFSQYTGEILIESTINGPEFTCPVLEYPDGETKALPPIEIRPKSAAFFDFEAKYTDNGSEEIVPAPCTAEITAAIQSTALKAHVILGCRGVSRTDMILSGDILYVLEVNTLPGLTENSLLPKSFKTTGGTYTGLIDILIQTSAKKTKT
jgi:D-alanine-D-alanine ligase